MIRIYAAIAAAVFLCASSAWVGHKVTAASYQADIIKEQQAAAEAIAAAARQANAQAEELEKARADREIIYRTITKQVDRIVDRPIYRTDCIDDDGLRSINEAITGAPASASKPDAAMPKIRTDGRKDRR